MCGVKIADPTNIRRYTVAFFSEKTDAFNYFTHLCATSSPDVAARHVLINTSGIPVKGSEKLRAIAASERAEHMGMGMGIGMGSGGVDGATRIG